MCLRSYEQLKQFRANHECAKARACGAEANVGEADVCRRLASPNAANLGRNAASR